MDFIGKDDLKKNKKNGIKRKQVGILIHDKPMLGPNTHHWDINKDNKHIGKVTSAVYSPRLKLNIGLAIVDINYSAIGSTFLVSIGNSIVDAEVVKKPFYDPNKSIAKNSNI